jgi:hypothetical protein
MPSRSVEMHHSQNQVASPADHEASSDSSEDESTGEELPHPAIEDSSDIQDEQDPHGWRKFFVRSLALTCAMALSIGSHL